MVYHILKDGTVKTDITGHVVKISDVPQVYDLISNIESRSIVKKELKKEA